jgi:hypothetical protein
MRSIDMGAASTAELVAGIAALAAELASRRAPEPGAICYEQAETLGRAVDVIESAIAARVTAATRTGQVAEWGHTSPTAWLRTGLGMRHARAGERAVLAAQLPRLPQVTKRLAAGDLSAGYAAAIAAGVRRLDETDCGKAEDLLLSFVDAGHSVGQITRFADKIKDLIAERDDTAPEPDDGRRAERQWWAMHRSGAGAFVKGHFGAELIALIKAKLEPLAVPCGPDDVRDHPERLADALQTFLSAGDSRWDPILVINLKQPDLAQPITPQPPASRRTPHLPPPPTFTGAQKYGDPPGTEHAAVPDALEPSERRAPTASHHPGGLEAHPAGEPPHVVPAQPTVRCGPSETTTEPTAPGSPGRPGSPGSPGTPRISQMSQMFRPPGPGWPFDGTPFTARLTDGTHISSERARQILLNAGYSSLVLGADGHPLYLGRRVRCATPAQRRVLLTRYATCVVDGCEIPATGCQIDHVDGWENGQPSDIDRLVMCCAFHNRYKWRHPDRITITQDAGKYRYQIVRPGNRPRDHRGGNPLRPVIARRGP